MIKKSRATCSFLLAADGIKTPRLYGAGPDRRIQERRSVWQKQILEGIEKELKFMQNEQ